MFNPTIDELVDLFHPTHVAINNPITRGIPTPGDTLVSSFQVEYDEMDGLLLWVTIKR